MSIGTVIGSTRRALLWVSRASHASRIVRMPPMPEETTEPSRSPSTSGEPASAQASRAAMIAYCAEGSIFFSSGRARTSAGSTLMVAANSTGRPNRSTQSLSKRRAPDSPFSAAAQVLGTSPPRGVVAPSPVTTTSGTWLIGAPGRRSRGCEGWSVPGVARDRPGGSGSGLRGRDERDGIADGGEVLDLVVGDAHVELLLGERDDRHHRQGVDVEVVGEGLLGQDGVGGQPGLLADDLGQAGQDLLLAVRHRCLLVSVMLLRG